MFVVEVVDGLQVDEEEEGEEEASSKSKATGLAKMFSAETYFLSCISR